MEHILLVDDDILFLQAICSETDFISLGFSQVHTATNLTDAKNILLRNPISVLLCDIEMPGESGLDFINWVQSQDLPIITILLTCYSSFDYAQRAIRLGVFDYILKPVRNELLCIRLKQALDQLHKQQKDGALSGMPPENNLVVQIQQYIEKNIHTELTREQIGKDFFMNPDYIARVFRNETNTRLNDYIRTRRIERAKELLMKTELPLKDICSKVGYGYNTYFFNTFKSATGMSPAEYRKKK